MPYFGASCFPTLFFSKNGDLYGNTEHSSAATLIHKVRYLIEYCETINGRYISRFAKHIRFICWIFNIYYRHRTLSQGDIYIQQNPADARLTVDSIRQMIQNNETAGLLNRIKRYIANIPGTPSY